MEPIDYTMNVADPIQMALKGYAERVAMQQQDRQLGMEQQRIDLAQQAFQADQARMVQQQQQAQQAAAAQEQAQRAFADYVMDPNKTYEKTKAVVEANPQLAEAVMGQWQGMNEAQQAGVSTFAKQLSYAIGTGNLGAAKQMLKERAEAARNAGNEPEAAAYQSQLQMLDAGEEGAQAVLGTSMAALYGVLDPDEMKKHSELVFGPEVENKPLSDIGKLEDDFRAGRISPEAYQAELQRRAPKESRVQVGADGSVTITEGATATGGEMNVGDVYNPGEVQGTLDLIREIKEDPSLGRVTGPIIGGGGNDVEEFGVARRAAYGSEGIALIEKMNQLQSRSWLAARDMLKGGGPITDYESRKAEAAVARMSRTKDEGEFKAALQELEDAIVVGMEKLQGGGQSDEAILAAAKATIQGGGTLTKEQADQVRAIMAKGKQ